MKKTVFSIIYSFIILTASPAKNFYQSALEQGKKIFITIRDNTGGYCATLYIGKEGYSLSFDSVGAYIVTNRIREDDNGIYLNFISIWVGAEQFLPRERRYINYNEMTVPKTLIAAALAEKEDFVWMDYKAAQDITLISFEDIEGSIVKQLNFYTKLTVNVYAENNSGSKIVNNIMPYTEFQIEGFLPDVKNKNIYFVKIKTDFLQGWIPLSALADNWTVRKNNSKYNNTIEVNAKQIFVEGDNGSEEKTVMQGWVEASIFSVINDMRVPLYTSPDSASDIIGFLNNGNEVKSLDEYKQIHGFYWLHIQVVDGESKDLEGWIDGKYLHWEWRTPDGRIVEP